MCRARRCSRFEKPLEVAGGVRLTFKLAQNHGGWNSDDNQNNNLGRFRFSVTTADNAVADPLPADVRAILQVPAADANAEQTARVFSYWRTTVPEWQEENRRIEALWQSHPQGATQLALVEREKTAQDASAGSRQLPRAGGRSVARRAGVSESAREADASRSAADAARFRPLAGRSPFADDGPLDRESHLAGVFRHRPGGDGRRPGHARRSAVASGAFGLAGGRADG